MLDPVKREVSLILPMSPNMELAAAQTASTLAELMDYKTDRIDEIQLAIIEACINAFEHSESKDRRVFIKFIMRADELEFQIKDRGVGLRANSVQSSKVGRVGQPRKRGWGLEIMRNLMDTVNVQSSEGGTTITMVKRKMPSNQG